MSLVLAVAVAILYAIAFHQLLGRDTYRIAFGLYLLLNATNLFLLAAISTRGQRAPFSELESPFVDPLVQAMVLTAIVIAFGVATLVLMLVAKLARARNTKDVDELHNWRH